VGTWSAAPNPIEPGNRPVKQKEPTMARNPKVANKSANRRPRPAAAGGRVRRGRPKVCVFCGAHATWVDYKDVGLLRRFVNDRGRIKSRGATGTCAQHQRDVATAIKTARELALLPYSVRTTAEGRAGRSGDRRIPSGDAAGGRSDRDPAGSPDEPGDLGPSGEPGDPAATSG
jgi:small subunit ribosomal protein S18